MNITNLDFYSLSDILYFLGFFILLYLLPILIFLLIIIKKYPLTKKQHLSYIIIFLSINLLNLVLSLATYLLIAGSTSLEVGLPLPFYMMIEEFVGGDIYHKTYLFSIILNFIFWYLVTYPLLKPSSVPENGDLSSKHKDRMIIRVVLISLLVLLLFWRIIPSEKWASHNISIAKQFYEFFFPPELTPFDIMGPL